MNNLNLYSLLAKSATSTCCKKEKLNPFFGRLFSGSLMKNLWKFCVLMALAMVAAATDSIQPLVPDHKAVVTPKTFYQRLFSVLPVAELERLMSDKIFLEQLAPASGRSIPQGIQFTWRFQGERGKIHYELYLGQKEDLSDARSFEPPHSAYFVNNLLPGETYFWKVQSVTADGTVTADSGIRQFKVEFLLPRVIALPDCWNVRDIGGRTAIDGRCAAFGKVFRSGGFNSNSADGGKTPGGRILTEDSVREALEVLKIRTELDLRRKDEVADMTESPLGRAVQYINIPTLDYGTMYSAEGMKNYAELFRIFTKADNYPIDFHCIAGADRTGTLAFLLESTLGYSPEDIRRDYTYTTLFLPRHFSAIDSLLAGMEAYGSAEEPLRYKAERFLLHCGITPDEILAFQEIMLGPNLSKSEVLEKARFVSALKAEFSKETDVTVIDTSPVVGMMLQCNRLHTITMGNWLFSPVEFSGGDDAGRFLVQLKNTGTREMYAGFQGGARDGSYKLMDVDSKKFYGVFTAEELGKMSFVLKGQSKALLMLEPASDNSVPEGYAEEPLAKPTATMLLARSLGTPPTIDGEIDDVWNTVPSMPMSDIRGMALEGNGDYVRLATNATHDMLYFLVNVVDITPIGEKSEHDSKEAWEGDAIEIFVSCAGCSDYYHFICGRGGSTYDERLKDISWNWENSQCAVASSDNAWTAEIALPLSPLNLEGPVEINVCIADTPGPRLKNLRATGGNFHLREAIVPVWLESPTDAERK